MTKSPHELFAAERPVRSDFARRQAGIPYAIRRLITMTILLIVVVGGGSWGWHRFWPSTPGEIPTVRAEGPYKQKPEEPGGVDIPNQDVQVYHEIDGATPKAGAKPVIEHMLPPPEEPDIKSDNTSAPNFSQATNTETSKIEELKPVAESKADPILDAPQPTIATTVTPVQTKPSVTPPSVVTPAPVVESAPVKEPVIKTPPVDAKQAEPATKGHSVVQLAAMQDEHAAASLTEKLQSKYKTILGSNHLHTVRADLGAKGIFYRIQSLPMSESQAKSICASIKAQNAGCILVHQ